jgi:DegV family protein with EDD domain
MPKLKYTPSTSPPSTMDFYQTYEQFADDYEHIISIHISKLMSETYNSAENARMMLPFIDIRLFDTMSTGSSLGLVVLEAAKAVVEGKSIDEVCLIVENTIKNVRVIGFASTLRYLIKGGRIGRARGLVGTLLGRLPILTIFEGETSSVSTARGIENAIEWIIDFLKKEKLNSNSIVSLTHGDIVDIATEFKKILVNEFKCNVEFTGLVGPVVGSHLGPGSLFFSYIKED